MSQKALFVIAGTVIIVGGGYYLVNNYNNQTTPSASLSPQLTVDSGMPVPNTNTEKKVVTEVNNSRYLPYTNTAYTASGDKKRILYFHADWCPVCRPLDKELTEKMDQIPRDVVIFKVNYDKEVDLKKQHTITYQHTFVQVDKNGDEVTRWSGGSLAEILKNIK